MSKTKKRKTRFFRIREIERKLSHLQTLSDRIAQQNERLDQIQLDLSEIKERIVRRKHRRLMSLLPKNNQKTTQLPKNADPPSPQYESLQKPAANKNLSANTTTQLDFTRIMKMLSDPQLQATLKKLL
jgi:hypothetical protein